MTGMSPLEAFYQLESSRELLPTEPTAPLVGSADDVIVLTTIHQAKGLEWPIVCLTNLQSSPMKKSSLFSARHGALLCKPLEVEGTSPLLLSLEVINAEIKSRAEAEERRLLYVALTRARERLILSACVKEKVGEDKEKAWPPKAFNALTFLAGNSRGALTNAGEHDAGSYNTRVIYVRDDIREHTMYNGGETLAETWKPEAGGAPELVPALITALPLSLKVTELLEYRRCPEVYRFSQVLEVKEHLSRRATIRAGGSASIGDVTPVELGTIVHALLERIRFDAEDPDTEIARVVADEVEKRRPALTKMLKGVVDGEIGAAIRNAKRVEREWPFATRVGGMLVEGVIDLAIQAPDGRWSIMDYKSNDISRTGRFEYLTDYYAPQLELYATALAKSGIGIVSECALVFLAGPKVHRWGFDVTNRAIEAWSEQTVTRIAARSYATVAGPKCDSCGYRKQKICEIGRSWTPENIGAAAMEPGPMRARSE
jgi:ATP-dependent helicase/nuclease subunit A